jgi:murein DD-endopeptidase MepM/ murein hydrolase activator NlpD
MNRKVTSLVLFTCFAIGIAACKQTLQKNGQATGWGFILKYAVKAPATPKDTQNRQLEGRYTKITSHVVERASNTFNTLRRAEISAAEIQKIVAASELHFPLTKVRPGTAMRIGWAVNEDDESSDPLEMHVEIDPLTRMIIKKDEEGSWQSELIKIPYRTAITSFAGTVTSNLWGSAIVSGMDPSLIGDLANIFAWQLDFNREVKHGDKWRIVVERKEVDGKPVGWGNILVAEYVNRGQTYSGVRYPLAEEGASYYDLHGKSLKKMFLKAPMKFTQITSKFQLKRFHPILKKVRPHNGVDYGAPSGTPILAVGGGRVVFAGWGGESGYMVKIRHNAVYTTAYLHMKSFADNVRVGSKVDQSQVIGYVGSTGLSSGPHLHFSFYENNQYVDPLGMKFPSADPISSSEMPSFNSVAKDLVSKLPPYPAEEPILASSGRIKEVAVENRRK